MKIMFYCINGTGIGHLTRTLSLVKSINKLYSKYELRVISNGKFDPGFKEINVPFYSTKYSNLDVHRYPHLECEVNNELQDRILGFDPDIIFFDNRVPPFIKKIRGFKILMLRSLKEEYMINTIAEFTSKIDLFIIPHDFSELQEQYSEKFVSILKENRDILVLGPIIKNVFSPKPLKKVNKLIVSLGGGGPHSALKKGEFFDDVESYAKTFLEYFNKTNLTFPVDIIVGPNFDSKLFNELFSNIKNTKISLLRFSNNYFLDLSSSLVFSLLGYNSVNELLYLQIPTIFFSKRSVSESQPNRGIWIQKSNLGLFMNSVTEESISKAIIEIESNRSMINRNLKRLNLIPKNDLIIKEVIKRYNNNLSC